MASSKLSILAETLIASEIVSLGATIKQKINAGEKIFNYTIGDFDSTQFPIPLELKLAIIDAYNNGFTTYPAADGELELRQQVCRFMETHLGITYSTNEILIGAGGRPLIYATYRAIADKGDKVIYPVPSWNNNHYVHFTEGNHVLIEASPENNFMPTADQLKPHIKSASLIALCSPLNPTGTTFNKEELEAICDLIIEENKTRGENEKKLYLMFDQIYWTLTFGSTTHYNPVSLRPEMKNYTILIDGISKSFAATGVRVGWAMGPANVIAKMRSINSHVGAWAPMAEQHAVAAFFKNENAVENWFVHFKKEIAFRLDAIYNGIKTMADEGLPIEAIPPQAAIYLTLQINLVGRKTANGKILNSQEEVTAYILNEARLAIVPFYAFGASKKSAWYRLSVGCSKKEEIDEMLHMLKTALEKTSKVEALA
ncbi:MAG TPA: aminotransferase class I/II-fold pyridoxal phosphate-dependent enzyme [Ferruginibacter sp.]|jgi:aspartate aminotransferase|nr:aminotransferase class I/II-fold pyridoxal phosphate-dependent enzyme [Bacteroidota bacterium]MBS1926814.1 aminotransferase class I/II-fold pyridoxal phosphate-dependent enzyme [Bacteroidota bacterium]MCC6693795.1 aminotransferase class I/II-fold pyridoxal phosphate-dependent enzyme [Chitinophagaceae bacterium]HMT96520.1 aminotransferase class I/II-fold pyridoxal phosphate-dependent enzyme [Ferruginibacter sp.]